MPDDHISYLLANFDKEELSVGGTRLLADPDARKLMVNAYRKLTGTHNFTDAPEDQVVHEIKTQINLMRSGAVNDIYGFMDGLEE